ncbi:lipase family protein [Streptomyces sp. H39-S7]|uniref:lipase family protein n=1 Tax=Streptomyces sp. H39-S7 TaxID=3004357 RepID=UPI0022B0601B|nr:lipase family protein [Streptomyces sp. H39-S7]MCZ4119600.1 triacylglycerol lipase [Streptomyces sp. H39-S7]
MARTTTRRLALCATTAVLSAALSLPALPAGAVTAGAETAGGTPTATTCTAADGEIYTPPEEAPATPGTVVACRRVTLTQVPGNIAMTAWKVQYSSTDNTGAPVAVSGTVAVPSKAWTGPGARPIVAFNPGTLGLGPQCAFSKQLAGAFQDEYEGDNIAALLKAGYAVAATDGAGYLDGQVHPYVSGADAGHALLDIARAAPSVPGSGLSARAGVALWGYSEGGAASLWAAQLAHGYAPELKVVGVASGGVPGDLKVVAPALNGGAFAGFLADAAIGMATSHPQLPFTELLNSTGEDVIARAETVCLVGTVAGFAGARIESYTTNGYTLEQLYTLAGPDGTTWGEVLDAQKLGVGVGPSRSSATYPIGFPVLQYKGLVDEVIPGATEDATRAAYCRSGITTTWKTYPGDHLLADQQAVGDVVAWLGDRFQGKWDLGNCLLP